MTRIKGDPEHLDSRPGFSINSGGGGRRKQSKPIRVFTDAHSAAPPVANVPGDDATAGRAVAMEVDMPNHHHPHLSDTSALMPPAFMDNDEDGEDGNSSQFSGGDDDNANSVAFPTKYHQLGSVFQDTINNINGDEEDSSNKVQDLATAPSSDRAPLKTPDMPQRPPSMGGLLETEGVPVGKNKIFHKDAYCELCDREFCNKYFLKTHRANMHGIFDEDSNDSSRSRGPNSGLPVSGALEGMQNLPMPSMTMPLSLPDVQQRPPSMSGGSLTNGSSGNQSPTSDITKLLQASKALTPSMSSKSLPSSLGGSILPHPVPATPPKLGQGQGNKGKHDMEDYCEICQKHFCNKYYLKKHKQDVHGIMPEPSPASSGKRGRPPMSAQLGGPPAISMPSSLSASLASSLIMPPGVVMSSANGGSVPPGMPPGLSNVMLLNPFAPPMLLQGMQGGQGVLPPGFAPGSLPPLQAAGGNKTDISPKAGSAGSVGDNNASAPNAEAYCEICRKEFCNKYFLRVHKATKHGIFLDEDMMPTTGPQSGLPLLPTSGSGSDLPPGTINITPKEPDSIKTKDEDNSDPPKILAGAKERNLSLADSNEHSNSSAMMEESCHVCKKQFGNKYNLKVHMINAHGITIPDFDLSPPRDMKGRSPADKPMQSTMFGNMIAAKLADRVMCDICNKEVCNKYFLKTHKIKVHGCDPAKVEAEAHQSPSKKHLMSAAFPNMQLKAMQQNLMANESRSTGSSHPLDLQNLSNNTKSDVKPPAEGLLVNGADANAVRPKDEDLLKMGIDPEAYCEICKKEFCSKYFLKTHKQNIHGIKMDGGSGSIVTSLPGAMLNLTNPLMAFPKLDPSNPDMAGGLGLLGRPDMTAAMAMAMSRGEPFFPLGFMNNGSGKPASSGNTSPVSQPDSEASGPWKWRESPTAGSQRQVCELCNKELCNKMFLQQHLFKKHGLMWDMQGPQSSSVPIMPFPPGLLPPGMPAHLLGGAAANGDGPMNLFPFMGSAATAARASDEAQQPLDLKKSPTEGEKSSADDVKTTSGWHLPFSTPVGAKQPLSSVDKESGVACEICASRFGDKSTLQLHMIQEHPADIVVRARRAGASGASSGVCALGSRKSLVQSLRRKYALKRRRLARSLAFGSSSAGNSGGVTNVFSSEGGVHYSANGEQQRKMFRCAYCRERFALRSDCQQHIQSTHPNAKKGSAIRLHSNKENRPGFQQASINDSSMEVSEVHASPLSNGQPDRPITSMQSFVMEAHGQFAPARLVLPVYEKIDQPISITLRLTPAH